MVCYRHVIQRSYLHVWKRIRSRGLQEPSFSSALTEYLAFDKRIRDITARRGVDVVVDYIGNDTWVQSLRSARKGGRVLTCGATTGFAPQTDLRHIFYRQVQVLGSTMGSHRDFLDVMKCIIRGQLRPVIDQVLPLEEARRGHEFIESRKVFGKLVLTP